MNWVVDIPPLYHEVNKQVKELCVLYNTIYLYKSIYICISLRKEKNMDGSTWKSY